MFDRNVEEDVQEQKHGCRHVLRQGTKIKLKVKMKLVFVGPTQNLGWT